MGAAVLIGGAQPIFIIQLKIDPTVWKTCLRLLMEAQLKNMLKLLHQRVYSFFLLLFLVAVFRMERLIVNFFLNILQMEKFVIFITLAPVRFLINH
jgi:hypothetical protein